MGIREVRMFTMIGRNPDSVRARYIAQIMLFCLCCAAACAPMTVEAGRVLDAVTGESIMDAVIVTWWTRQVDQGTARERPECVAIQVVPMESMGNFALPSVPESLGAAHGTVLRQHLFVYKTGYLEDSRSYTEKAMRNEEFFLHRDTLSVDMRMDYLVAVLAKFECPAQLHRRWVMKTVFKAIYDEARSLRARGANEEVFGQAMRRIAYAWSGQREMRSRAQLERYFEDVVAREIEE